MLLSRVPQGASLRLFGDTPTSAIDLMRAHPAVEELEGWTQYGCVSRWSPKILPFERVYGVASVRFPSPFRGIARPAPWLDQPALADVRSRMEREVFRTFRAIDATFDIALYLRGTEGFAWAEPS